MGDEMLKFRKNALLGNMCEEGREAWRACHGDKEKLVALCMEQRFIPFFCTYCANGKGLSKEYILKEYGEYINGKQTLYDCDGVHGYSYGLFVDYAGRSMTLDVDVAHMMFCDGVTITIAETRCPIIYVSNNSDITIACDGYNTLKVYAFDNSKITFYDMDEESDVIVYKYSKDVKVEKGTYCLGKVKEFDKDLNKII